MTPPAFPPKTAPASPLSLPPKQPALTLMPPAPLRTPAPWNPLPLPCAPRPDLLQKWGPSTVSQLDAGYPCLQQERRKAVQARRLVLGPALSAGTSVPSIRRLTSRPLPSALASHRRSALNEPASVRTSIHENNELNKPPAVP